MRVLNFIPNIIDNNNYISSHQFTSDSPCLSSPWLCPNISTSRVMHGHLSHLIGGILQTWFQLSFFCFCLCVDDSLSKVIWNIKIQIKDISSPQVYQRWEVWYIFLLPKVRVISVYKAVAVFVAFNYDWDSDSVSKFFILACSQGVFSWKVPPPVYSLCRQVWVHTVIWVEPGGFTQVRNVTSSSNCLDTNELTLKNWCCHPEHWEEARLEASILSKLSPAAPQFLLRHSCGSV